jgi:pyruvate/2-oxoacid:ferredoxin oxidoreductase alpha subunit
MMEPVELSGPVLHGRRKGWAVYGDKKSRNNLITSIYMSPEQLKEHNEQLQQTYASVEEACVSSQSYRLDDAEFVVIAYGISARISHSAVMKLRDQGIKAGLLRPKSLYPFPKQEIAHLARKHIPFAVVELSNGQMADDVELAAHSHVPVFRHMYMGGVIPTVEELTAALQSDVVPQRRRGVV